MFDTTKAAEIFKTAKERNYGELEFIDSEHTQQRPQPQPQPQPQHQQQLPNPQTTGNGLAASTPFPMSHHGSGSQLAGAAAPKAMGMSVPNPLSSSPPPAYSPTASELKAGGIQPPPVLAKTGPKGPMICVQFVTSQQTTLEYLQGVFPPKADISTKKLTNDLRYAQTGTNLNSARVGLTIPFLCSVRVTCASLQEAHSLLTRAQDMGFAKCDIVECV